jgi:hypothetical protein
MTAMDLGATSSLGLNDSHVCLICREVYTDAFSTLCGHTFCFRCVTSHLEHTRTCPCCFQVSRGASGPTV